MNEQIALILHADVEVYRPYLWTHIQKTIDDYKSSYEFFYPIVCYCNANAPAPASIGNSRHLPLRETGAAMLVAEEAGCDYALISPALTRLTEPLNILKPEHYDTGICFVGSFQPRLYFGEVSKIKRIEGLEKHHAKNNGDLRLHIKEQDKKINTLKKDIEIIREGNEHLGIYRQN